MPPSGEVNSPLQVQTDPLPKNRFPFDREKTSRRSIETSPFLPHPRRPLFCRIVSDCARDVAAGEREPSLPYSTVGSIPLGRRRRKGLDSA